MLEPETVRISRQRVEPEHGTLRMHLPQTELEADMRRLDRWVSALRVARTVTYVVVTALAAIEILLLAECVR